MAHNPPSLFNKLALSLGLIVTSAAYAIGQHVTGETAPAVAATLTQDDSAQITTVPSLTVKNNDLQETLAQNTPSVTRTVAPTTAAPAPTPAATPAPISNASSGMGMSGTSMGSGMMTGQYRDGSYTGSAADAYYGTVQVQAVISSGRLADVQFLQYPNNRGNSVRINSYAMPILTQEAVQAQNAHVDGVSGATFTSEAFIQSLSSALAQAKT